jgi:hypothetical protein
MFARLLAALVALVTPAVAAERSLMTVLVPAYFYPTAAGSDWDRMTAALASGVPIIAIMNPATGPGNQVDAQYTRAISAFRSAGGRVLGYVPSGYAGRRVEPTSSCRPTEGYRYSVDDLVACADRYRAMYAIDGIFVDEMGGEALGVQADEVSAFYTRLYDGLKRIDDGWRVVGNPGTSASQHLLRRGREGGADALISFEGLAVDFSSAPSAPRAQSDNFGAILIETSPTFDVSAFLAQAAARNFGLIYATDAVLPNPYDRLPSDWDTYVTALRALNASRTR